MAEAKKAVKKAKEAVKEAEDPIVADAVVEAAPVKDEKVAKAGKRSAKALEEVAEKEAKEERKASSKTDDVKPKAPVQPARARVERRGKGFQKSAEQIEKGKNYSLSEAVELAKKTSHVKFDATVEMHVRLGVDPRQADQNIRDNLVLPAGTGKEVKVVVLSDELFADLDKGTINFDVLVATPEQMPKLAKYARLLGPRGLMPNPKSGTVTTDTKKAVEEAKAGRVEYRVDSTGIVHLGIGKASFTPTQLQQNAEAVIASVKANKPQSFKGNYFRSIYLTTSMGPSVSVDLAAVN
jgi:large subunit ribosomal protein L1